MDLFLAVEPDELVKSKACEVIVSPEILRGETTYIFDKMVNIANIVPNLYMLKSPRPAIGRAGE